MTVPLELGIIKDETDLDNIRYPSEKGIARAFLAKGLEVKYEVETFWAFQERNGKLRTVGHQPDFVVFNPHNPRVGEIYVEVTESSFDPLDDPKAKQKYVMDQIKQAIPGMRYTVLYEEHLANVQRCTGLPILSRPPKHSTKIDNAPTETVVPPEPSSKLPKTATVFLSEKPEPFPHRLVPKRPIEPRLVG